MKATPKRCSWCGTDELYIKYHDNEWGKFVQDDQILYEFLILEGAQAGLSWITILKRRDSYGLAFANFDFNIVANYTQEKIEELLSSSNIVKHRGKIGSAITNAKLFIEVRKEYGSFFNYLYSFMPNNKPILNNFDSQSEVPTRTKISDSISKDMKKRGFKFFGTTICYAFMQAVGMVNDHISSCPFR
ncbi:DNA-3-methyladenine glycosylase I [Sphingobacterium sp. UT-1RO-CII-1]|uniref:DNA-3-methyladenine glycosylase I n=1 Tax=Sphingobacterium sp. UT-1RO-CII-1 TaxID=2995225 RepID=UPI00227C4174|nr:DNA-3-methyladenine glycosylase I [Sphingobacterium sp. UT-1RO-CII-1]MCY4781023.1 DNA-3-methyladenine glycosylase I [Sphingobacterium sp. UT-1RO-CII-1]